ncbi:MAG: DUF2339 domain-containing protein [Desulfamplus sp.]|nr:DUF2339 domain-containing protein [Desulfamplus sp.]
MRYIFLGIVFAILAGMIPRYSGNHIFGFVLGLFFAQILSLRRRVASLERAASEKTQPSSLPSKIHSRSDEVKPDKHDTHSKEQASPSKEHDTTSKEYDTSALKQGFSDQQQLFLDQEKSSSEPQQNESHGRSENITDAKYQKKDQTSSSHLETTSNDDKVTSSHLKTITDYIKAFFTTGNVVLKTGIIVVFFGVAFLLKYAAQHNMFPVELRLIAVAAGGLAMLVTGWSMKNKVSRNYGLVLQGGGIGILYLTIFAASKLYHLLPTAFSLVIMIVIVAFSAALAVMQDARSLAVSGIIGGFIAPVLMSTGRGSHVTLFSYYAILNCGILGIAWFKAWRELNLVGFAFTFVICSLWGGKYYKPEFFSTTEPFLILFFLFYVTISFLFAHQQPPKLKGFIDGTIVFGLPVVAFGLQSTMVRHMEYGLAISALGLGLFYIIVATLLWNRLVDGMRMLTEAFLAMGVVFGSLAIPLALDGRWTSSVWALEGAAMIWVGTRQNRLLARLFGILLQLGAGVAFISAGHNHPFYLSHSLSNLFSHYNSVHQYYSGAVSHTMHSSGMIFFNQIYIGAIFISIAGLFSSYYIHSYISARNNTASSNVSKTGHNCSQSTEIVGKSYIETRLRSWECYFHIPLLVWGVAWWFGGGANEIDHHFTALDKYYSLHKYLAFLLYCAVSCQILSVISVRLKWKNLLGAMTLFLPVMICILALGLFDLYGSSHLFAKWGAVSWVVSFAVQYGLLWQFDKYLNEKNIEKNENNSRKNKNNSKKFAYLKTGFISLKLKLIAWSHLVTMWLLIFILSHEAAWAVRQFVNPSGHPTIPYSHLIIWSKICWGVIPALFILFLVRKGSLLKWPVGKHAGYYFGKGITIPAFFLILWILWSNFYHGDPVFVPYIPVANPLELSQIFALTVLAGWTIGLPYTDSGAKSKDPLKESPDPSRESSAPWSRTSYSENKEKEKKDEVRRIISKKVIILTLAFIWLNFVTGRIVHFYFDIPFDLRDLADSVIFQAAISILWGVMALFITAFATRTGRRKMWFCGAFLLGLLVLKLFTVDLSGIRTVARIISFLAVGGLMLLIGYISPLPPDDQKGSK